MSAPMSREHVRAEVFPMVMVKLAGLPRVTSGEPARTVTAISASVHGPFSAAVAVGSVYAVGEGLGVADGLVGRSSVVVAEGLGPAVAAIPGPGFDEFGSPQE